MRRAITGGTFMERTEREKTRQATEALPSENGFIRIVAGGKTVAAFHEASGDVFFIDPEAERSETVAEIAAELRKERSDRPAWRIHDGYCRVHMLVEGRYDAFVPKGTVEEMKTAGTELYYDADFGDLHEIEMAAVLYIMDEDGNYLYRQGDDEDAPAK